MESPLFVEKPVKIVIQKDVNTKCRIITVQRGKRVKVMHAGDGHVLYTDSKGVFRTSKDNFFNRFEPLSEELEKQEAKDGKQA